MSNLDATESVEGDTMRLAGESNTMRMSDTPGDDEHMVAAEEVKEETNIEDELFTLPPEDAATFNAPASVAPTLSMSSASLASTTPQLNEIL